MYAATAPSTSPRSRSRSCAALTHRLLREHRIGRVARELAEQRDHRRQLPLRLAQLLEPRGDARAVRRLAQRAAVHLERLALIAQLLGVNLADARDHVEALLRVADRAERDLERLD